MHSRGDAFSLHCLSAEAQSGEVTLQLDKITDSKIGNPIWDPWPHAEAAAAGNLNFKTGWQASPPEWSLSFLNYRTVDILRTRNYSLYPNFASSVTSDALAARFY